MTSHPELRTIPTLVSARWEFLQCCRTAALKPDGRLTRFHVICEAQHRPLKISQSLADGVNSDEALAALFWSDLLPSFLWTRPIGEFLPPFMVARHLDCSRQWLTAHWRDRLRLYAIETQWGRMYWEPRVEQVDLHPNEPLLSPWAWLRKQEGEQ